MNSYRNETWRRGTVRVNVSQYVWETSVPTDVPALVRGRLAIRLDTRPTYYVIHAPTGLGTGAKFRTQRDAKAACDRIARRFPDLVKLDVDPTVGWTSKKCTDARKFMRKISNA